MKKYIFANLKMNMCLKETESYIEQLLPKVVNSKNEIIICPSYTNLMFASQKLTASKVFLGAQNLHYEPNGAYTGEVSGAMLKSVGVIYVLVGHSERRKYNYEKNDHINKKIKEAFKNGLKVVLCIGESKYERVNKKYKQVLQKEVSEALKGLYENELKNIIIAYEPVWAIGTGKLPEPKQIEESVAIIREQIQSEYSEKTAKSVKVLYGGSINAQNAKTYSEIKNINGLLVGGASLNVTEFSKICNI